MLSNQKQCDSPWLSRLNKELILLVLITLIGAYLRFNGLGKESLFIDEAWAGFLSFNSHITQEFIPAYANKIIGQKSEFWLRFFPALCGTISIIAIYYVVKNNKLFWALFVAVFPLFVFWSRLNRPYSCAGLFVILSWHNKWFGVPALLSTPLALIGMKFKTFKIFLIFVGIAGFFYLLRIDNGNNWVSYFQERYDPEEMNLPFRFFYIPLIALICYSSKYKIPFNRLTLTIGSIIISFSLTTSYFIQPGQWYSKDFPCFSDWRKIPAVDYSTNALVSQWYSGHKTKSLKDTDDLKDFYEEKDTVTVGIDYYIVRPILKNEYELFFGDNWEIKQIYREHFSYGFASYFKYYRGKIFY